MDISEVDLSTSEALTQDCVVLEPTTTHQQQNFPYSAPPSTASSPFRPILPVSPPRPTISLPFSLPRTSEGEDSSDETHHSVVVGVVSPGRQSRKNREDKRVPRSKSQDSKTARSYQSITKQTSSSEQTVSKEGPPPPSYIPAPPSRKERRHSQMPSKPNLSREDDDDDEEGGGGPPPPLYVPPLPSTLDSIPAIPIPLPTLDSQQEFISEEERLATRECAFGVTYLVSQLSTLVEVIDCVVKAWLRPLEEGRYIQKQVLDSQYENLTQFHESVLSANLMKLLKSFTDCPTCHEEALQRVLQQIMQQQQQQQQQQGTEAPPIAQKYQILQEPIGKIHKDLPLLWSLIVELEDFHEDLKGRLKNQYSSCQHYQKSAMEQMERLTTHNSSLYWTAPQLLDSGMNSIESIASELKSICKHLEKKQQQLSFECSKNITTSFSFLNQLKEFIEKEQPYLENLTELSETITIPLRYKLDVLVPGRRFLKSAILNHYIYTSGKLKKGDQTRVFLFNDLLLFTQPKAKESRRQSGSKTATPLFRMPGSPRITKEVYKLMHFFYLDQLTIAEQAYGSENLVEFSGPGKKILVAVDELRIKTEWLKSVQTQARLWKSQISDKKFRPEVESSDIPSSEVKDYNKKKEPSDSSKKATDPDVKEVRRESAKRDRLTISSDPDVKDFGKRDKRDTSKNNSSPPPSLGGSGSVNASYVDQDLVVKKNLGFETSPTPVSMKKVKSSSELTDKQQQQQQQDTKQNSSLIGGTDGSGGSIGDDKKTVEKEKANLECDVKEIKKEGGIGFTSKKNIAIEKI